MDTHNDTSVSRKNKHLNEFERGQIAALYREGLSKYKIAKRLGRALNTISNELKRGTVEQVKQGIKVNIYYPDTGQLIYEQNRKSCGKKFKLFACQDFIEYASKEFHTKSHSLDAICGRAKKLGLFTPEEMVCTKTLYNYIDLGLLSILNIDLPYKVKCSTKRKHTRKHKRTLGTSIDERPDHIGDRTEFGHWEIDLVLGKKTKDQQALLTLTERKTRQEIICKIASKTAEAVMSPLEALLDTYGTKVGQVFKTITSDNGSEFADLIDIESKYGTKVYFAHPYSSCERGTNERHNGLIRRFIPKGKSFNDFSLAAIARIENWMNQLPRKILDYLTPEEAFAAQLEKIMFRY